MSGRAAWLRRAAVVAWLALALSVAAWLTAPGISRFAWAFAFLPVLLPLPWMLGGSERAPVFVVPR